MIDLVVVGLLLLIGGSIGFLLGQHGGYNDGKVTGFLEGQQRMLQELNDANKNPQTTEDFAEESYRQQTVSALDEWRKLHG